MSTRNIRNEWTANELMSATVAPRVESERERFARVLARPAKPHPVRVIRRPSIVARVLRAIGF